MRGTFLSISFHTLFYSFLRDSLQVLMVIYLLIWKTMPSFNFAFHVIDIWGRKILSCWCLIWPLLSASSERYAISPVLWFNMCSCGCFAGHNLWHLHLYLCEEKPPCGKKNVEGLRVGGWALFYLLMKNSAALGCSPKKRRKKSASDVFEKSKTPQLLDLQAK